MLLPLEEREREDEEEDEARTEARSTCPLKGFCNGLLTTVA